MNVLGPRHKDEVYKPLAMYKKAHESWDMYEEAHVPGFEARW